MDDRLHGEQGWRCRPKTRTVLGRHPEIGRDLELARSLGLTLDQFDHLAASERDYWITHWEAQRLTCQDCGNPLDECSDPKRIWFPYRRVCYATMEKQAAEAAYEGLHGEAAGWHDGTFTNWGKVRSEAHPYGANFGMSIGVTKRDVAPHDHFTTDRDASPLASVAEESPGDEDEPHGPEEHGGDAE